MVKSIVVKDKQLENRFMTIQGKLITKHKKKFSDESTLRAMIDFVEENNENE